MTNPESTAPQDPHQLKIPSHMSSVGPVEDMAEAYMKSIVALPELLQAIHEELSVIALYCEKKGLAEGILKNDDLEGDEDGRPEKD